MAAIFELIGGFKGLAIIALVIALGGYLFVQKQHVKSAELARDQAIAQRDQAATERDKAIAVAQENALTIKRLEQEKVDINDALNKLAAAKETTRVVTVTRQELINKQADVPANKAVVAPVLSDIIASIQQDRLARRNGATQ